MSKPGDSISALMLSIFGVPPENGSPGTHAELKVKIEEALATLTYREREVIKLRYGVADGTSHSTSYSLEEVGRIFKITRERVRQVEAKAIRKLQHPARAGKLKGFLPAPVRNRLESTSSVADKSVADLDVPIRTRRALQRMGIRSLGELAERRENELVRHMGPVAISELRTVLEAQGLKFRD